VTSSSVLILVMVNCVCQPNWARGYLYIWSNIILGISEIYLAVLGLEFKDLHLLVDTLSHKPHPQPFLL
jgi:hypothetical protein